MRARVLAAAFLLAASAAFAADTEADLLVGRAADALGAKKPADADFWLARAIGLSTRDGRPAASAEALVSSRAPAPAGFLPEEFDLEFLDWFEKATWRRWGVSAEHVRERYRSVELARTTGDGYFAAIAGYPKIEAWYTTSSSAGVTSRKLLVAAADPRFLLLSGKSSHGVSFDFPIVNVETRERSVLQIWPPEFHDLDGDQKPELWLRFNLAADNGFTQVLDVYRVNDDRGLERIRRFEGPWEGLAMRTGERAVRTAAGFAGRRGLSHLEFDRHRIENWEWSDEEWKKTGESDSPHFLRSKEWKTTVSGWVGSASDAH